MAWKKEYWVHIVSIFLAVRSFNISKLKSPVIIMSDVPVSTASATEFSMLVKYSRQNWEADKKDQIITSYCS